MARWDEILSLPVQSPPNIEFSASDIVWSRVEGWRETMDRLALIPFSRVNDFVRGESNNKDCPTRFHVEARRRRSPEMANKLKVVMPTVEADVAFGLGKFHLTPDEVKSRVSVALDAVGMLKYSQRPIQTLSGGQKQRVAIAGALAEACKVLLLDELTTFLDEYDQLGVIKAVKNCVSSNGEVAALWVTHRLEELKYADGAFYMEDGRIVTHGDVPSIIEFLKQKQANYIEHFNL